MFKALLNENIISLIDMKKEFGINYKITKPSKIHDLLVHVMSKIHCLMKHENYIDIIQITNNYISKTNYYNKKKDCEIIIEYFKNKYEIENKIENFMEFMDDMLDNKIVEIDSFIEYVKLSLHQSSTMYHFLNINIICYSYMVYKITKIYIKLNEILSYFIYLDNKILDKSIKKEIRINTICVINNTEINNILKLKVEDDLKNQFNYLLIEEVIEDISFFIKMNNDFGIYYSELNISFKNLIENLEIVLSVFIRIVNAYRNNK